MKLLKVTLLIAYATCIFSLTAADKPNIIVVFNDDMGYE